MFRKILFACLTAIALFLGYVAAKPSAYVVSREISINAPAGKVFPYLNNSRLAEQWGPWLELDPDAKMTYSGPDAGVGSKANWTGGKQLGTGSATITESVPDEKVKIQLEYTEPMQMTQQAEYLLRTEGEQVVVTWRVLGENNFVGRLMCVFMNMDKTVGGMFEKGLAKLKTVAEKPN